MQTNLDNFSCLQCNDPQLIDKQWDKFEEIFNSTAFKHAPLKQLTKKEKKLNSKPWITKGILKSIKTKNRLYKKYMKKNSNEIKAFYKRYRNLLTRVKEQSKKLFLQDSIKQAGKDNKKLWRIVNNVINHKQPKKSVIDSVINPGTGKVVNNSSEISNLMNTNFVSLVDNLVKKFTQPISTNTVLSSNQADRVSDVFSLKPITIAEVKRYINELNDNKSTRSDLPKIFFLKISVNIISPVITTIFNNCISNGFFPTSLKVAEIIPIYKSGSKSDINNYRPISLLSPFSKILESHVHNNLNKFFEKHKVIYNNQFGFIKDSSTELAVINSVNDIISSIDDNKINCSIFLDLAKAFNSVNHTILLDKLDKYGVRGIALQLIENYLNNRIQRTIINSHVSKNLPINVGVPQGSCLGPLLFLIYVNDMHLCTKLKLQLFADDACLSLSHEDPIYLENTVNIELINIDNWLTNNKLFLNYSKSSFLIFNKKQHQHKFQISINNNILKQNHIAKYLGITIDDNLNWKPHINDLKLSLSRNCYALCKLKNYANIYTLKNVYYSLFYSKVKYCISSYGSTTKTNLNTIFNLQKRAIRFICSESYRAPTNQLFIKLKMLKLNEIHVLEICKLIHKILNNNLQGTLQLNSLDNIHSYNTRLKAKHNFFVNSCKTSLGKQGFNNIAAKFWRDIPNDLKKLNFGSFKFKLKQILLEKYSSI